MLRLLALAGLAVTMAGAPAALAQDATFYTVTYVEVGPVLAKLGAATLKTYRDVAKKDAGVVSLEVLQRIDRPNQFIVLGAWVSGRLAGRIHDKISEVRGIPQHYGVGDSRLDVGLAHIRQ